MKDEEFKNFINETMPLAEKLVEVAKKYNPGNELICVTCSADGYVDISNYKLGHVYRLKFGGKTHIRNREDEDYVSV